MNIRMIQLALFAASLSVLSCNRGSAGPSKMTIAVIPKGTSHVYWQSIHAGANQAAEELGVDVIWRGPIREDDRDSQVSEVEGFIRRECVGDVPERDAPDELCRGHVHQQLPEGFPGRLCP